MTSDLEDPYVIDLLDIRQAATLLKVSETSLRRWTNAGTLPCLRIDGRRGGRAGRSARPPRRPSDRWDAGQH